ncbi:DNA polymerase III subunit beta [Dyadobacter chenhuakuii]|uniref:Beta sliding clamp n=1 Tax=Dyadobacter chenhuakuii TaxID=2909339 RepID=A0A9X1TVJ6_9BACT|nr:DNA polymerase III subunit beta [Dyadobacter chenhuakuii]MCF2500137.1 DNA polymerase III subunit beta [Dyadobacter chenhuakuii]
MDDIAISIPSKEFKAKAIVSSNILLEKVRDLAFCVGKNIDLPILSNLKVELSEGQIALTSSDLINTAKARIEGIVEGQADVCVSFDLLSKHLASLENEEISLSIDSLQQRLTVYTEQAEYELPLESSENWPKISELKPSYECNISLRKLASRFNEMLPFVSHEFSRQNLNGINLRFGTSKLVISATDANAFCIKHIHIKDLPSPIEENLSITVSSKIARAFTSFANIDDTESIIIRLNDTNLSFSELPNGMSIVTQLIDGVFPDLEKLIPSNNTHRLIIDRNKLLSALIRALPFTDDDLKYVRIKLASSEYINLRAEDSSNTKHAWENIPASYKGDEFEFGISISYLKNGLNFWKSEAVAIELSQSDKPIVLRDPEGEENNVVVISTARLGSNY